MVPIAKEFDVPLTAVTAVFTHHVVAAPGGRDGGRLDGRSDGSKSSADDLHSWYSLCNFIAGFSPTFAFLFFFRALLGIGMGAEWPAGAALAMESWPARSRGFMSGVLQGSWGLGFALSALAYGFLFDVIGWRGLLWIGILPAFVVIWIRFYVKEPEVWVENKRQQRETKAEVKAPLFSIFKRGLLFNTLTACLWMGSAFCVYYSIWALFSTYLQKELNWTPLMVATPLFWANIVVFAGSALWGFVSDRWGRRPGDHRSGHDRDFRDAALSVDSGSDLDHLRASSCKASSADRSTARTRAICPSASRPRCGRRRPDSSIIRGRSGAAWLRRC